ncbi:MAG: hypothetical protein WED05_05305 [Candidatus Atabeyarchaeum deiterrae]
MTLRGTAADSLSVHLDLKYGIFEYTNVSVAGKEYADSIGNVAYDLEAKDVLSGFFMGLTVLPEVTFVDMAFDGGESQLCYRGVASVGSSSAYVQGSGSLQSLALNQFSFLLPDYAFGYASLSYGELSQAMLADCYNGIHVSVDPSYQARLESSTSLASVSPNIVIPDIGSYGIVHQFAYYGVLSLPAQLATNGIYWGGVCVDMGINRSPASKAEVLSDLREYNKWYTSPHWAYRNNMRVYAIYAHSDYDVNTVWHSKPYGETGDEVITYGEVAGLWYHSYNPSTHVEIDVHPRSTVILANVCYGYNGTDGIPHMAKAFVDYGAAAFVGATVSVPGDICNDNFSRAFWTRLCNHHGTVNTAANDLIIFHNVFYQTPQDLRR